MNIHKLVYILLITIIPFIQFGRTLEPLQIIIISLIDKFLMVYIIPRVDLTLKFNSYLLDKGKKKLTLTFDNLSGLTSRSLYIDLYYLIITNPQFKTFAVHKIFISHALTDRDVNVKIKPTSTWNSNSFNLHSNYYYSSFQPNLGLVNFLKYTEHSFINLTTNSQHSYFGFNILQVVVDVWSIDNMDSKIKVANNERIAASPRLSDGFLKTSFSRRLYSTAKNVSNQKDFTPLSMVRAALACLTPINIVAMDIETLAHMVKGREIQIPILITLAFKDLQGKLISTKFLIDWTLLRKVGYQYAVAKLWREYFIYITNNIPKDSVIFLHNLGSFDGIFIFKGLLNHCKDPKQVTSIIDKDNNFIQITAILDEMTFVFKDSFRIFPISLNKFCGAMGVEGKIGDYQPIFNRPELFNSENSEVFNKFMQYSEQDSICLFNGLEVAQDHYLESYNVDIGSIWSTSTLSLKIFRTNYITPFCFALC